jgi:hypothetical protein
MPRWFAWLQGRGKDVPRRERQSSTPAPLRATRSFGGKGGPRQRPGLDATHLIADPEGVRNKFAGSLEGADNHQNHDPDHQKRRDFVGDAIETRRARVPIQGKVLSPHRQAAMIGRQQQHEDKFGVEPPVL